MTITQDKVVSIEYVLRDDQGKVLDESGESPLVYLHGHGNIIPGLEQALSGKAVGDKTKASVAPSDGYGEYDPQLKFSIPRQNLGSEIPAVGTMVGLETPDGHRMMASIAEIAGDHVVLDANHPLAGQNLHFEVSIVSIRAAQPEELAHGHVHGPGGHHH